MIAREHCIREFGNRFGESPDFVARAPGRVNLIGEHTDYNDGFVLPVAIDMAVWIVLRATSSRNVIIHSLDLDQSAMFSLDNIQHENQGWLEYIKGIAHVLGKAGYPLSGWEGLIASDIPMGAGLASSAALEIAATRAFVAVLDYPWEAIEMARIGQQAEIDWIGVNCGIMDQMISAMGQVGHGLLIDCRSLKIESVPLPPDTTIVVLDTSTRRGLVDSVYNERRDQCKEVSRIFGVPTLRDVSEAKLIDNADKLDSVIYKRARHVITESMRTLEAANAMKENNSKKLGMLLNESHESLRDDFEVSSPELDQMVKCARNESDCYGARMTGAGFGGCAVALFRAETARECTERVISSYQEDTGLSATAYACIPSNGATLVTV